MALSHLWCDMRYILNKEENSSMSILSLPWKLITCGLDTYKTQQKYFYFHPINHRKNTRQFVVSSTISTILENRFICKKRFPDD